MRPYQNNREWCSIFSARSTIAVLVELQVRNDAPAPKSSLPKVCGQDRIDRQARTIKSAPMMPLLKSKDPLVDGTQIVGIP